MAFSMTRFSTFSAEFSHISQKFSSIPPPITCSPQFRYNYSYKSPRFWYKLKFCYAAAKQERSGGSSTTKKRKNSIRKNSIESSIEDDFVIGNTGGDGRVEVLESPSQSENTALLLPKPPAGFVLDERGRVLKASSKRIATIVSDEEVEVILPTAAYALAKIHMHLVYSGFCYTARGGFCYTEEDIFEVHMDSGEDVDGLATEGIEIVCFHLDGSHYMIYTPSDPLLFVAVKDKNGVLQIADDELLEDPAIISSIDEETEFNALVEEEAALFESLIGKR
ncbi:uncharacterized protein LOC142536896 isoform X2 [Primulina tabacum]|uniref:uncharacterized protein LOC142536896 isoform X2 n=1 Tax=Primulina tabacum TaxID=48773 RepID=UPI003F59BC63